MRKIFAMLHSAPCDNYVIVKSLFTSNVSRVILLIVSGLLNIIYIIVGLQSLIKGGGGMTFQKLIHWGGDGGGIFC